MATKFGLLGSAAAFQSDPYAFSSYEEDEDDFEPIDVDLTSEALAAAYPEDEPLPTTGLLNAPALATEPLQVDEPEDPIDVDLTSANDDDPDEPVSVDLTTNDGDDQEVLVTARERPRPAGRPQAYETPQEIYAALRNGTFDEDAFWGRGQDEEPKEEGEEEQEPGAGLLSQETLDAIGEIERRELEGNRHLPLPEQARSGQNLVGPPPAPEVQAENPAALGEWMRRQIDFNARTEAANAEPVEGRQATARTSPGDRVLEQWVNANRADPAAMRQGFAEAARQAYRNDPTMVARFPSSGALEAAIERELVRLTPEMQNYAAYAERALASGVVGGPTTVTTGLAGPAGPDMTQEELDQANTPTASQSLAIGGAQARQMIFSGVQALSEFAGAETPAAWAGERATANRLLAEAAPQGTRLENIDSVADALAWVKHTFISQVPMLATPMSGAVVGGIIRGSIGARMGAFGGSYMLGTGEIQSQNKALNPEEQAGFATILGGGAVAALDSITPNRLGNLLVTQFGREAAEGMANRILLMPTRERLMAQGRAVARETGASAVREAPTEAMQAALANIATAIETGTPVDIGDTAWQMLEEGLAGAVVGGGTGAATSAATEASRPGMRSAIREMRRAEFAQTPEEVARNVTSPSQRSGDINPSAVDLRSEPRVRSDPPRSGQQPMFARGPVTSSYGPRGSFRTRNGQRASSNHQGVDVGAPMGAPIPAMVDGTVVHAGERGGLGNAVAIRGADGWTYWAGHMSRVGVSVGTRVRQGQNIGAVGQSGNATGPHVHYAVRDAEGRFVNPTTLRPTRGAANGAAEAIAPEEIAQAPVVDNSAEYEAAFAQSEADQALIEAADAEHQEAAQLAAEGPEATRERAVNAPTVQEAIETARSIPTETPATQIADAARSRLDALASPNTEEGLVQEDGREPVYGDMDSTGERPLLGYRTPDQVGFTPLDQSAPAGGAVGPVAEGAGFRPTDTAIAPDAVPTASPVPVVELVGNQTVVTNVTPEQATAIAEAVGVAAVPRSDGAMVFPPSAIEAVTEAAASVAPAPQSAIPDVPPPADLGAAPDMTGTGFTSQVAEMLGERIVEAPGAVATPPVEAGSPEVSPETSGETQQIQQSSELPTTNEIKAEADRRGLRGGARVDFIAGAINVVTGQGQAAGLIPKRIADQRAGSDWVASRVRAQRVGAVSLPEAAAPASAAPVETVAAPDLVAAEAATSATDVAGSATVAAIDAQAEAYDDKLFDLETDGEKAPVRAFAKKLLKAGVIDQAEYDALGTMFKDKDMGAEDIAPELRTSVQIWAEQAKARVATESAKPSVTENVRPKRKAPPKVRGKGKVDLSALSPQPSPEPSLAKILADLPNKIAEGVAKALGGVLGTAKAAPVAPEPKPVGQMTTDELAAELTENVIPKLSSFEFEESKTEGSNPGGIYEKDGHRWLVKGANNPSDDRAKNEVLASKLMQAAGLAAPDMILVDLEGKYGGGLGVASRIVELYPWNKNWASHVELAQDDFAIHAWLANYDAVGLPVGDNLAINNKGQVFNFDPGGALMFRAQGLPKFGPGETLPNSANEWETMRQSSQAGQVYGPMSDGKLSYSASRLEDLNDNVIRDLVIDYGPGTGAERLALADALVARKYDILARAGLATTAPSWQVDFVAGSATLTGVNEKSPYMVIGGSDGTEAGSEQAATGAAVAGAEEAVGSVAAPEGVGTGTVAPGQAEAGEQLELYPGADLGSIALPEFVTVNGIERPTTNADGDPIAGTTQGVINFWNWFGDSRAVDDDGQPVVFYHGNQRSDIRAFGKPGGMRRNYFFFTDKREVALTYSDNVVATYLRTGVAENYDAEGRNWTRVVEDGPDEDAIMEATDQYISDQMDSFYPSGSVEEIEQEREALPPTLDEIKAEADDQGLKGAKRRDFIKGAQNFVAGDEVVGDWQEVGADWVRSREGETDTVWMVRHPEGTDQVYDTEEEAEEALQELQNDERDEYASNIEVETWQLVNGGYLEKGDSKSTDELAKAALEEGGVDTIWIEDVVDTSSGHGPASTVVIVLNQPTNIKAIDNTGGFDPENPDIYFRADKPQSLEDQPWPELLAQVEGEVLDELGKMALPPEIAKVVGQLRQNARAKGGYNRETRTILIAARLASGDARQTTRHEAIHYLKANGFFTEAEWGALEKWAKQQTGLMRQIRNHPDYAGLSEEKIIEETIAEGFARLMGGQPVNVPSGLVEAAFEKLRQIVRAVLQALGRRGLSTEFAEAIMANVMSGEQVALKAKRALEPSPDGRLLSNPKNVREELTRVRQRLHDNGTLATGEELLGKGFWGWTGEELEMVRAMSGEVEVDFSVLDDPTVPSPGRFKAMTAIARAFKALGDKQRRAYSGLNNRMKDYRAQDTIVYDPTDSIKRVIKRHFMQERETVEEVAKRMATELGYDKNTLPPDLNFGNLMIADDRGYHIEWFVDNQLRPLIDAMHASNISQDDLELFLYAKHAPFRNARIAAINPEFNLTDKPGSGMTDAEAGQIVQDVTDAGKLAEFEAAAEMVYDMNRKAMEHRITGGLLTPAEVAQMFPDDAFYVPLRGRQELDTDTEMDWMALPQKGAGGTSGFSVKGSDILRAKGRTTKADDIITYVMAQHMSAIDRSYRHRVAQKMGEAFTADPNVTDDFVAINPVKRVAVWNKAKGIVEYQMQTRLNAAEEQRALYFKKNGKTYKMLFNEKNPTAMRFVKQAKGMDLQGVSLLTALATKTTHWFSKAVTSLNPNFWVSNTEADAGYGITSAWSLRKKHPGAFKTYLKVLPQIIPALIRSEVKKTGAGLASANKFDFLNAERELFGGKIIFNQIDNVWTAQRRLLSEMRQANRSNFNPLKWGRALLNFVGAVTNITDNVHRLAYYIAVREIGLDPIAAAKEARQITVDFGQRGELSKKLNRYYAFFNVTMVGGHLGWRVLKRSPQIAAGMFALGSFYAVMGPLMFGDDWDDFTEEEKSRFFLFPNGSGGAFSWRLPHFFGGIINAGRKSTEYVLGHRDERGEPITAAGAAWDVALAMATATSPVQGQNWQSLLAPTGLDPLVDTMVSNENFWGRPIGPVHTGRPGERPLWTRSYDSTAPAWVAVARTISDWTGGSTVAGGFLDPSAEGIKYIVNYYTGGPGRALTSTYDVLSGTRDPTGLPVVSALMRWPHGQNPEGQEQARFSERFRTLREIMTRAEDEAEAAGEGQPVPFIADNARMIRFGELPASGGRNLYQHFNYWQDKFNDVENAMDRVALRAGRNILQPERNPITVATATDQQPGIVLPVGQPLSDEQINQVLERVRQNRLFTAREFNAAYEQALLGQSPSE